MIVKFKNGYQVQIRDCAGKSYKELIEIAKKAVKDAVTLEKRIDTNTSFMPTKMKAAIAAEDLDMFSREMRFLVRDLKADLSESHKNYAKMYRPEVLEKLLSQYEEALKLVEKADTKFGIKNAEQLRKDIEQLRENWGMTKKAVEDARDDIPPYRVKITYENGEVTIKYVDDLTAAVKDIRGRIAAGKKDGNKVAVALVFDSMTDEIVLSSAHDADIRVEDTKKQVKDDWDEAANLAQDAYEILKKRMDMTTLAKELLYADVSAGDSDDAQTAALNVVDASGETVDSWEEFIKKVGAEKAADMLFNEMLLEPLINILNSIASKHNIKIPFVNVDTIYDSKKAVKDASTEYSVLIDFTDHNSESKVFTTLKDAINYIYSVMWKHEGTESELSIASVYDDNDNWLVEITPENYHTNPKFLKNLDILFEDAKKKAVKDAPPPYFDPTDYPSIKSDYSVDRLSREARHLKKGSPILSELDDVHSEIDELIAKGSDALIDAGWSKDDARRAIATRYTALEKELRKNNLKDEARELHKKIRALEKAWDLRV